VKSKSVLREGIGEIQQLEKKRCRYSRRSNYIQKSFYYPIFVMWRNSLLLLQCAQNIRC